MDVPPIHYARTADGLNIAYQVVGDGLFDLVFVPQVVSNIQLFWENRRWAIFMRSVAAFSRLILFDRRGVGLSDRPSGVPALEQRMDDVRAVMDAVASERAALLGAGADGAMAALFAATYPERVSALVLYAVPPRGLWAPDYPWGLREEAARGAVEEAERRFAQPDYLAEVAHRLFPSVADDDEAKAFQDYAVRLAAQQAALPELLLDLAALLTAAQTQGWALVALDSAPATPAADAKPSLVAAFAPFERRLISQRTRQALARKRGQGVRLGRPPTITPYVIERIRRERAAGKTLAAIADGLNNDHVPTAQGGQRWYPATIHHTLKRTR